MNNYTWWKLVRNLNIAGFCSQWKKPQLYLKVKDKYISIYLLALESIILITVLPKICLKKITLNLRLPKNIKIQAEVLFLAQNVYLDAIL